MNQNEIKLALTSATTFESYMLIRNKFSQIEEAELFLGLYPIAVSSQRHGPAFNAARLLYELNPACQIICKEAIAAMLPEWDISIEEVPFYLCKQFGVRQVSDEVERLRSASLSGEEVARLNTIQYWSRIAEQKVNV